PPALTLTAVTAAGGYAGGTWSRTAVTVTFACTSGVAVTTCPGPRTVSSDTPASGLLVSGMMQDALGRTATAAILVRVDGTPSAQGGESSGNSGNTGNSSNGNGSNGNGNGNGGTGGSSSGATTGQAFSPLPDRMALGPVAADGSSVFARGSGVPVIFRAVGGT